MKWSNGDLATLIGVTRQTFYLYVVRLTEKKKFRKKSPGRYYTKEDVRCLAGLIGFDFQDAINQKQQGAN